MNVPEPTVSRAEARKLPLNSNPRPRSKHGLHRASSLVPKHLQEPPPDFMLALATFDLLNRLCAPLESFVASTPPLCIILGHEVVFLPAL